jgi:hypothetical protein
MRPGALNIGLVLATLTTASMRVPDRRKRDPSIYLLYHVERRSEGPERQPEGTPLAAQDVEPAYVAKVI